MPVLYYIYSDLTMIEDSIEHFGGLFDEPGQPLEIKCNPAIIAKQRKIFSQTEALILVNGFLK